MRCQSCGYHLRVARTVSATDSCKVGELVCPRCLSTYVSVTTIVHEQGAYGTGAHGVARKIAEGKLRIVVEES